LRTRKARRYRGRVEEGKSTRRDSLRSVAFPRPLSETEKAVAWNLLQGAGTPELHVLAEQLDAACATSKCECGCPTISMAVDATREIYWWSDDAPTEFPNLSQLTDHRLR
jgi:hypothetical protein